jgi:3-deoxy-manno-octulosonate cytidylyltransferase (CMP-KDO synthetase)
LTTGNDSLILIPARYQSTRFPGKPLSKMPNLSEKTMIHEVYSRCLLTGLKVAVVTDHSLIAEHVKSFNGQVYTVEDDVPSGSERIWLAYERYIQSQNPHISYLINVQGDEPLVDPKDLIQLLNFHKKTDFAVTTMVKLRKDLEGVKNPNVVKVDFDEVSGACRDFFRNEPVNVTRWFQHIGVYCYKVESLKKLTHLPPDPLEMARRLEQMRLLQQGEKYGAIVTKNEYVGIDTPDDLEKIKKYYQFN